MPWHNYFISYSKCIQKVTNHKLTFGILRSIWLHHSSINKNKTIFITWTLSWNLICFSLNFLTETTLWKQSVKYKILTPLLNSQTLCVNIPAHHKWLQSSWVLQNLSLNSNQLAFYGKLTIQSLRSTCTCTCRGKKGHAEGSFLLPKLTYSSLIHVKC